MNAAKIINLALDFETIQIGAGAAAGQVKHQEARIVEGFFSILDDSFRPVGQEFGGVVKRTAAELGEETAKKSLEISGISSDEILKGTDEEKFFADLRAMLDGARGEEGAMFRPVGHNINNFDIPILKRALGDDYHKYFVDESVDTLVETQRFVKSSKGASPFPSSKLADVFETLHEGASGPDYEPFRPYVGGGHHRARGDAYKSAYVANRLRVTPSLPRGFANPHVTQGPVSAAPRPSVSHLGLGLMAAGALYMGSGSTRDPDAQPNPVLAKWEGIRQSYPTNPNEFEAMKPHAEYGFPGGRAQFYEALGRGRLTDANSIDPVKFANATGTKVWNVKHGDAVGVTDRFLSGSEGFTTEMGTGNWRPFLNKRFYDNYKKGKVSRGRMNRVIMHESSEVVYSKRFGSEAYSEAFGHAHPGVLANEARLASMMSEKDRAAYAREQRIYLRDFDKKVKEGYVPTRNDLRMQRMARRTAKLMDGDYQYQHRPLGQMVMPERPTPVTRRPLGRTAVPKIVIPDYIPDPEPGSIPSVEPTIETLKYRRPVPKLVVRKTPRIPGPAVVEQYAPSVSPRSVPATPRGPATSTGLGASSFEAEVAVGRFPQPKPFTRVVIGRGTIAPVQPPPVVEVLKEAPRGPVIIARGPILRAAPTRAVPVPPMAESSAPAKAAVEVVERKISRPLKVIPGGEPTKFGSPMLKMAAAVIAGAAAISYFVNSQPKETPEEEEASINGIRQSYPTNPNQFEAIAPHSEFGFPGGREQPYNNRLVSPSKQSREDCIKSRVPGKKERLTFHPSKAFHKRRQPVRGNVGSRRER